jgi:3-oxoacyl-[acyl-carrier protein] reductase
MDTIPAPLHNKVALITGGTSGIGHAIALELARQGCSHIAITCRSSPFKPALDALRAISPTIKTYAVHASVSSPTFGPDVIAAALSGLGVSRLDILISNAALTSVEAYLPVAEMTKAHFDEYMTTNAWAGFSLAVAAETHMPGPNGRIIFISSGGSKLPFGDPMVGHCFSKAALDSIARNLAEVYGKDGRLTVNSIGVGVTDTASLQRADAMYPGYKKVAEGLSFMNRAGTAEEVASVVAFVAGPGSAWINGNQVPCNGGQLRVLQS